LVLKNRYEFLGVHRVQKYLRYSFLETLKISFFYNGLSKLFCWNKIYMVLIFPNKLIFKNKQNQTLPRISAVSSAVHNTNDVEDDDIMEIAAPGCKKRKLNQIFSDNAGTNK
jgi:hypothetical protein